jgi:hypothetical protein
MISTPAKQNTITIRKLFAEMTRQNYGELYSALGSRWLLQCWRVDRHFA